MASSSPEGLVESPLTAPRRKTFPRKGHTKSRKGCYNCKRRKIKCQENRPCCSNCVKADLDCSYPVAISRWAMQPSPIMQPQATPTVFSMDDLMLFHHFIVRAYPHLPVGEDNLWKSEIPAYAHQYDFLVHSMLALAASHLSMNSLGDYTSAALQHRVVAVRLLNESISKRTATQAEADAKLAACLALTFQSAYMDDGFLEFLTMIRGCGLVTQDFSTERTASAFHSFSLDNHSRAMQQRLRRTVPSNEVDHAVLDQIAESLEALKPFCVNAKENEFRELLYDIVQQTYHSPLQAYYNFCDTYNWPSRLDHTEFAAFMNPSNQAGQLILSHFVALQLLQQCTTQFVWSDRGTAAPCSVNIAWIKKLDDGLLPEYKSYNAWPMKCTRMFEAFDDTGKMDTTLDHVTAKQQQLEPFLAKSGRDFDLANLDELVELESQLTRSFDV